MQSLSRPFAYSLIFAALLCSACETNGQVANQPVVPTEPVADTAERGPVLIELFTSQGCSSCPPADQVLQTLSKNEAEVMALSFHVDYWNRLGWKDPYSRAAFSERQRDYARQLPDRRVYTPQMVIDGRSGHVGSRRREITQALTAAQAQPNSTQIKYEITTLNNGQRQLDYELSGTTAGIQLQIALVLPAVENDVPRGENHGRHLVHTNVVQELLSQPVGKTAGTVTLPANPENSQRIALFTQQVQGMEVTGASWVVEL